MRRIIIAAALAAPLAFSSVASAEHMDVIEMEFVEGCSLGKLMPIVADFNAWGADYGYSARIAAPLQSNNLAHAFWLGTSENAATFGAAWDAWRDAQADSKSVPAKLQARFSDCTVNSSRRSYDVY